MYAGCRCPTCADVILEVDQQQGHRVLGCRRCGGAFVSAEVGLRLLAVLRPDVPPARHDLLHRSCPVCRTNMRVVLSHRATANIDVCASHGVWFDSGDLAAVMRAVAKALGKPIPQAARAIDDHISASMRRPPPPPTAGDEDTKSDAGPPDRRGGRQKRNELAATLAAVDTVLSPTTALDHALVVPLKMTFTAIEALADLLD